MIGTEDDETGVPPTVEQGKVPIKLAHYLGDETMAATAMEGSDDDGKGDDQEEIPSLSRALRAAVLAGGLPATASLPPTFMATRAFEGGEEAGGVWETAAPKLKRTAAGSCRRPREKLVTVLKESERLLRNARPPTLAKAQAPRRLDNFLLSLREQREHATTAQEASQSAHARLLSLLPQEVVQLKPRLSADFSPQDGLEIILGDDAKPGGGRQPNGDGGGNSRSRQIVRKAIAPRLKKASIVKLNEQLDAQIQRQRQQAQEGRRSSASQVVTKEMQQPREASSEDEFGLEEEQVLTDAASEDSELYVEPQESLDAPLVGSPKALQKSPRHWKRLSQRHGTESSDPEGDNGQESKQPPSTMPRRAILMPSESEDEDATGMGSEGENDSESEDNLLDQLIDDGQDSDASNLDLPMRRIEVEKKDIDLMLSGNFAPDPDTKSKSVVHGGDFAMGGGLIDEEAEDEDSQVSADEIDEEAIAKELQESAFVNDDEDDLGEEESQLALLKQMRDAEEAAELEMFMNRFVPDELLREMGPLGELRKKYADREGADGDYEYDGEVMTGDRGGETAAMPRSTFGQVSGFAVQAHTGSHPAFLKLLEQDRLSSETEPETEDSQGEDYDGEEQDDRPGDRHAPLSPNNDDANAVDGLVGDSIIMSFELCTTETVSISTREKRRTAQHCFVLDRVDESLLGRLNSTATAGGPNRDEADAASGGKRPRTTFETISARPVLPNDRRK